MKFCDNFLFTFRFCLFFVCLNKFLDCFYFSFIQRYCPGFHIRAMVQCGMVKSVNLASNMLKVHASNMLKYEIVAVNQC